MTRWAASTPVSDDEDDGEWDDVGECSNCQHQGITGTRCPVCEDTGFIHESVGVRQVWQARLRQEQGTTRTWRERMTRGIQRLVRVGRAGNALPEVGQSCLVLRGDEKKDLGQEAVVTKKSAARVHISYRDSNGRQATRLKHPGSLVLLEDGLHVTQDADGCV
jgi:hypothetical protein